MAQQALLASAKRSPIALGSGSALGRAQGAERGTKKHTNNKKKAKNQTNNNRSREEKTTGSKTKTRVPDAGSQQLVAAEAARGCDLLLQALGPHACDPGSTPGVRTFPLVLASSRCNGVSRKLVQRLAGGCSRQAGGGQPHLVIAASCAQCAFLVPTRSAVSQKFRHRDSNPGRSGEGRVS